jgi:hypothetical protein
MNAEDARLAAELDIMPLLHSFDELALLENLSMPIDVVIKCDTGMRRLGFTLDELPALIDRIKSNQKIHPRIILSHLACSDECNQDHVTLHQMRTFSVACQIVREAYPNIQPSLLNSSGMLIWPEIKQQAPDLAEVIEKYNKSFSRCTFYPWGIYITCHARFRLWSGILSVKDDYKYADTDSIKLTNYERHKAYFEAYNRNVLEGLKAAADYHKIPLSKFIPKTIKGVEKPLGVWDFDGDYTDFKTLGAKRYMYHADGELHCTIAGVNPQKGAEYFNFKYKGDLNRFTDSIVFPHEYKNEAGEIVSGTGKLTHSYDDCKDCELCGEMVDFQGRRAEYYERSFIHLEPADYSLSIGVDFAEFLTGGEMFVGV